MSNRVSKPKRTAAELIAMLRDEKGITFKEMCEADAEKYLSDYNNYLRAASYRKNYEKHTTGINAGKYIHLDFAYLAELSELDMYLRAYLLQMCIDIEHALKVKLIYDIENNEAEDGYAIVDGFLKDNPSVLNSIAQKADSVFTGDLIKKYFSLCSVFDRNGKMSTEIESEDCPVWVLVELLTFKELLYFLKYYLNQYPNRLKLNFSHLNIIRSLRNACAHNNCLLLSLRPGSTTPTASVSQYVAKIPAIRKEERRNKLSCRPLFEISCLLMEYDLLISAQLKNSRMHQLKTFFHGRLIERESFFQNNPTISTAMDFLQKMVDFFS